jgi:hypothetical protein
LANPAHVFDVRSALVRGMQLGRSILEVDCPDEEEPIVRVAEGRQILGIRAECETAYTERMLIQNR